jgi:AbrB family looped-hinge helix DNA binding protein
MPAEVPGKSFGANDECRACIKGQMVLPAAVRKALGLKPGMRVDKNGRIAVKESYFKNHTA